VQSESNATVGVIANPVSARDIRRIVANASNMQTADRVSIILRVLSSIYACGVRKVLMMPDKGGIRAMLMRRLAQEHHLAHGFPAIEFLDFDPRSTVDDTLRSAHMMRAAGVTAIAVLGGDGTHRAVVSECGQIPIAGLSTGTNNAFPEHREPTIVGIALGLFASGRLSAEEALARNKVIEVTVDPGNGKRVIRDIAIVDAVISTDRYIGARALWKSESLCAAYVTFASPEAIGLSSIAGLLLPVGRQEPGGVAVRIARPGTPSLFSLTAPIAPGMMTEIAIAGWERMVEGQSFPVELESGVIALDGERELTFDVGSKVAITLRENAFSTVDVARCMKHAAQKGLFRSIAPTTR
jgi:NAD+ kinase